MSQVSHSKSARKPGILGALTVAPGVGVALLAKAACPLCYPAIAGLLSSVGLGFAFSGTPLLILATVLIGLSLFGLVYRAPSRRGYRPSIAGLISVLVGAVGIAQEWDGVFYVGVMGLIAASVWNLLPKRSCGHCAPTREDSSGTSMERKSI